MKSTRLPGKAFLGIEGKPVLWHLMDRVSRAGLVKESVVCTSSLEDDDPIEVFSKEWGVQCYRGHPENVMERFLGAARKFKADHIVRITGDNPLTDPEIIDEMIETHLFKDADYTYTEDLPRGTRPEVISVKALEKCLRLAQDPNYSEYMTLYFKDNPNVFANVRHSVENKGLVRPDYILTIDTQEDFRVVERVYRHLYTSDPRFKLSDVVRFLDDHPEIEHTHRRKKKLAPDFINTKLNV